MKIFELFEQTIAPTPPGQPVPQNSDNKTNDTGATLGNQNPAQTTSQQSTTTTPPPAQQVGQNPQQSTASPQANQQIKQVADQSKQTMTDLDKIAAQIVGLKQKQQQMQQQLQQATV